MLSHVSPPAAGSLLFCLCLPLFFILTSVSHWAPPPLPPPLSRSLARSLPDPRKGSSAISHAVTPGRHGSSASAAPACLPLAALRRSDRLQLPIGPPRPGHFTGCFYFHSRVFVTHPQNSPPVPLPHLQVCPTLPCNWTWILISEEIENKSYVNAADQHSIVS